MADSDSGAEDYTNFEVIVDDKTRKPRLKQPGQVTKPSTRKHSPQYDNEELYENFDAHARMKAPQIDEQKLQNDRTKKVTTKKVSKAKNHEPVSGLNSFEAKLKQALVHRAESNRSNEMEGRKRPEVAKKPKPKRSEKPVEPTEQIHDNINTNKTANKPNINTNKTVNKPKDEKNVLDSDSTKAVISSDVIHNSDQKPLFGGATVPRPPTAHTPKLNKQPQKPKASKKTDVTQTLIYDTPRDEGVLMPAFDDPPPLPKEREIINNTDKEHGQECPTLSKNLYGPEPYVPETFVPAEKKKVSVYLGTDASLQLPVRRRSVQNTGRCAVICIIILALILTGSLAGNGTLLGLYIPLIFGGTESSNNTRDVNSCCPDGFTIFNDKLERCYYISEPNSSAVLNQSEATNYCNDMGGMLLSLENQDEFEFIEPHLMDQYDKRNTTIDTTIKRYHNIWTSLVQVTPRNNTMWSWFTGKSLGNWTNWKPGEPNHVEESCMELRPTNWTWNNRQCEELNMFACQTRTICT